MSIQEKMKYPIGVQTFKDLISDGYLYVDKTALVYELATTGKVYFLSRPRRFGKSLLVSTLESYFSGRKELFRGLAIESLEKDWTKHPVFRVDFNVNFFKPGNLEEALDVTISQWEQEYGRLENATDFGLRFAHVLREAHRKSGQRCVVLVDEYDKPLLDVLDTDLKVKVGEEDILLEEWNRRLLAGFYSVFKLADADLRFVLLTGVTKFSQVSVFSGFNQPKDISMDARYEELCGITQDELERYFACPIVELSEKMGIAKDELMRMLKAKYDGYHFSEKMTGIYNPFSLLSAFDSGKLDDWWFRTGTPSVLLRFLSHSPENAFADITERYYYTGEFIDYMADSQKPLPMIYQSGYLTIKAYNPRRNSYLLDFPNDEVAAGFLTLLGSGYFKKESGVFSNWMQDLGDAMGSGDTDRVRDLFTSFLADIPYELIDKSDPKLREKHFQYTLYLIFRFLGTYVVKAEKHSSQGRADCIVETSGYVYIFEFKLDGSAEEALRQIDERGYALPYSADRRKIIRLGVNFSSATGTISGWLCG